MPGRVAVVLAWHDPLGWELHIYGLGREAAATVGGYLMEPYFDFRTEGNATLSVTGSTISIAPTDQMEYQPDIFTAVYILRVLRQHPTGGSVGLYRRNWRLAWQTFCFAG